MTHCRNGIAFVHPTALVALVGLFSLTATGAGAEDMMGRNKAKESGVYVGLNYADVDTDGSNLDGTSFEYSGDGVGFLLGYRVDQNWRVEYQFQDNDYDDVTASTGNKLQNIESDIDIFSIIYQAHMGKWSPYARLAYVDSEVSETLVGAGGSPTESETISESGEAFGLGVDFNIGDRLAFRVDFTKGDEHDIFTLGPIYHF
ncbi:MAG: outer membrane beta-barrel protein [Parvibaculales bacterium]